MSHRGLLIVLFASLALNLFVIGALAGAGLAGARFRHVPDVRPSGPIAAAARALSPEARQAWRSSWPEHQRSFGPKMREARTLRRGAFLRFAEEPFDAQAVLADLSRARALEQEARAEMDRRLVAFAGTLGADERAKFGEALAAPRRGSGRGGGEGGGQALPHR